MHFVAVHMSPFGLGCVKMRAREERAELFSLCLLPTVVASGFVFQIDESSRKFYQRIRFRSFHTA
jgi:hypothetical protein